MIAHSTPPPPPPPPQFRCERPFEPGDLRTSAPPPPRATPSTSPSCLSLARWQAATVQRVPAPPTPVGPLLSSDSSGLRLRPKRSVFPPFGQREIWREEYCNGG